jgi:hypothetical protein
MLRGRSFRLRAGQRPKARPSAMTSGGGFDPRPPRSRLRHRPPPCRPRSKPLGCDIGGSGAILVPRRALGSRPAVRAALLPCTTCQTSPPPRRARRDPRTDLGSLGAARRRSRTALDDQRRAAVTITDRGHHHLVEIGEHQFGRASGGWPFDNAVPATRRRHHRRCESDRAETWAIAGSAKHGPAVHPSR